MTCQMDIFRGAAADPAGGHAVTPAWLTQLALGMLDGPPWGTVLDAGAGTGAIGREVERYALEQGEGVHVTALDVLPERQEAWPLHWARVCDDLRDWMPQSIADGRQWDLVVTNPPFSLWAPWVALCLQLTGCDLLVIAPLAYLAGQERRGLLGGDWPAKTITVAPRRPKGPGWENTRDIMAVHWQRGWAGETMIRFPGGA